MRRAIRRWSGRVALLLLAGLALDSGYRAVVTSAVLLEQARLYRREPFDEAQNRVLGRAYMDSVREVRARIPEKATVYLIDAVPRPSGAPYFAAHYLAPRRVVLLGTSRLERPRLVRSRLPRSADWVVVVNEEGAPLRLFDADQFRPRSERRGR